MTIDELLREKAKMEERIQSAINDEIKRFYLKTGIPVDGVYVSIKAVEQHGYIYPRYVMTDVECTLNLQRYQSPASASACTNEG